MAKKSVTFKGKVKPFGKSGHFHESRRHSLQARGIKTGNLSGYVPIAMGISKKNLKPVMDDLKEQGYSDFKKEKTNGFALPLNVTDFFAI